MSDEIKPIRHDFKIGSDEIVLELWYDPNDWGWNCKRISGEIGFAGATGGRYESMDDYIKYCVKEATYSYHFHRSGYKAAKEIVK